jgi:hypothetical protein
MKNTSANAVRRLTSAMVGSAEMGMSGLKAGSSLYAACCQLRERVARAHLD